MMRTRSAVLSALLLVLTGCSGVQRTVGGWFGEEAAAPGASVSGVYFAGSDGLVVHSDASSSSAVVGRLALHEKVVRSRLRGGYAYVVSEKSGLEGWVDNAQLVWRVPGTGSDPSSSKSASDPAATPPAPGAAAGPDVETSPGAAEAAPSGAEEAATDDVGDVTTDAPGEAAQGETPPDAAPAEPEPDSEPPAPAPVASPQPRQPTPEIFDPF